MVDYGSNSGYATSSSYQVIGYGNSSGNYSLYIPNSKKTTCCGARKFGQSCSDCPA